MFSSTRLKNRIRELTSVASSARYWRTELMRPISMYAALHVLMMCCFIERLLLKMKPRYRTIPKNSVSVLLREIVCGICMVVLTEEGVEKRMASFFVLFFIIQFEFVDYYP